MFTALSRVKSMSSDDAAAAWVYLTDPATALSYYANPATGETSWRLPPALGGPLDEPLFVRLHGGWLQFEDEATGRSYYYQKSSKRTTWIMPPEARPPPPEACDAAVFEAGLLGEPEGTGEEEDEDDDFVDEADDFGEEEEEEEDGLDGEDEDDEDAAAGSVDLRSIGLVSRRMSGAAAGVPSASSEADRAAEKAAKRAGRRLKILEEIITSERTYVSALSTLRKVYLVPLRTVADMPPGKGQIFTHKDLDAIFINIDLLIKVNESFLTELETELELRRGDYAHVQFGPIVKHAAKQLRGCYTRYVTNYDGAEAALQRLKGVDKEKHRYLEVCQTHPDAGGLDVRAFLIMPVQRVPRYRLLLEDLLAHTDEAHADESPLREALEKVCEVARHINEEKRHLDEMERLRALVQRFGGGAALEKELVSFERRMLKEGTLAKVRQSKRQKRHVFLCNDIFLYAAAQTTSPGRAAGSAPPLVLKGKIWLRDGARVQPLPSTEATPHAFAIVAGGGKGYTWLAESAAECKEWADALSAAIDECAGKGPARTATMRAASSFHPHTRGAGPPLARVPPKTLAARLDVCHGGSLLTKYNQRDGKASTRWVLLRDTRVLWGDARTRKVTGVLLLADALSLAHGAQSASFLKASHAKRRHADELCFSVVFRSRTLDFAADRCDVLLDWYLALASLLPKSEEPLLDESALRQRIEQMRAGDGG